MRLRNPFRSFHMPRLRYKQDGILVQSDYRRTRFKVLYGIMVAVLVLMLIAALFPLFFLFVQAFKSNAELTSSHFSFWPEAFDLGKIVDVWTKIGMGTYLTNTVIVIIGCAVCAIVFNGLLAYGVSILRPRGAKLIYGLIMGSYMIPTILSIVPLFKMISDIGLVNTYIPLWFSFGANAYYFILFKNFFDKIPSELVEAMRVDGAGDLMIFFRLALPLSSAIVGVVAIFSVTAAWSDFLLPNLVLKNDSMFTLMVKIFSINSTMGTVQGITPDMLLMALLISVIPQIAILLIFQRKITGGSLDGGVKG